MKGSADKCTYSVQTSVDKCRQRVYKKKKLSTLRNVLVISVVHTKSAECRQFAK